VSTHVRRESSSWVVGAVGVRALEPEEQEAQEADRAEDRGESVRRTPREL
jgi:hypothetical protein